MHDIRGSYQINVIRACWHQVHEHSTPVFHDLEQLEGVTLGRFLKEAFKCIGDSCLSFLYISFINRIGKTSEANQDWALSWSET